MDHYNLWWPSLIDKIFSASIWTIAWLGCILIISWMMDWKQWARAQQCSELHSVKIRFMWKPKYLQTILKYFIASSESLIQDKLRLVQDQIQTWFSDFRDALKRRDYNKQKILKRRINNVSYRGWNCLKIMKFWWQLRCKFIKFHNFMFGQLQRDLDFQTCKNYHDTLFEILDWNHL